MRVGQAFTNAGIICMSLQKIVLHTRVGYKHGICMVHTYMQTCIHAYIHADDDAVVERSKEHTHPHAQ